MATPLRLTLLDVPTLQDIVSTPSYTDIFNEVVGDAGTDADGFNTRVADLAKLVDAFDADVVATGAAVDIPGLVAQGMPDLAPLNSHMDGYAATKEYAMGIVAAAGDAREPQLLTLPLTPGDGSTQFIPPLQQTHDFGTAKLGGLAQAFFVGREIDTADGRTLGISTKGYVITAPGIFGEKIVEHDTNEGDVHLDTSLTMTPTLVGQWTAQYEYVNESNRQLVILTVTVHVEP